MTRAPRFHGRNRVDYDRDVVLTLVESDATKANPDFQHCVMARALLRDPNINEAFVGPMVVMIGFVGDPDNYYRVLQEPTSTDMIRTFDADPDSVRNAAKWIAGKTVTLKAPPPSRQLGTRTDSGSNIRGTGTRPNVYQARPFRYISRLED